MSDSSLQNTVVRANALRTEVKRLELSSNGQLLDSITVSIGVAACPEHGSRADILLRSADNALYESKANGRDTVTSASLKTSPLGSPQFSSSVLYE